MRHPFLLARKTGPSSRIAPSNKSPQPTSAEGVAVETTSRKGLTPHPVEGEEPVEQRLVLVSFVVVLVLADWPPFLPSENRTAFSSYLENEVHGDYSEN